MLFFNKKKGQLPAGLANKYIKKGKKEERKRIPMNTMDVEHTYLGP
jgi:hypothetical protein